MQVVQYTLITNLSVQQNTSHSLTTHNTPRYCTSVNNSSNLHLYIGHMHIHSSVYGHFSFCIFLFFITIVILNYCLFSSLLVFFITLIICCLCLYCIVSVLEAPNTKTNSLCVQTHLAIKLFLILILTLAPKKTVIRVHFLKHWYVYIWINSWINNLSIDVWLKSWNLRTQKKSKYWENHL